MNKAFINEVNATFAECGAFFRDTTLPEHVLAKYWPGVLLRERTFCDTSHRAGGFVAPHRYLIFSSNARSLDGIAPQPWGLCVWLPGRVFKIIDRWIDGEHTQLTLLEIPEHLLELFLGIEPNAIEQAFVNHGRALFAQHHAAPPVPELDTDEWRERLVYPVGVGDDGQYFPLYSAEDYAAGPHDGENIQESRSRRALVVCYLAATFMNAGAYSECDTLVGPAVQAYRSFAEPAPEPLANLLVTQATLRFDLGDLTGAEADLHDAFALRKLLSEDRLPVADVLSRLGHLYNVAGSTDAAERFYQHALKVKRRVAGSRSAEVLPTLVSLGALYERSNRFTAAEEHLREALEISAEHCASSI